MPESVGRRQPCLPTGSDKSLGGTRFVPCRFAPCPAGGPCHGERLHDRRVPRPRQSSPTPEQPVGSRAARHPIHHRAVPRPLWFVLTTGARREDAPPEPGCSGRTAHRRRPRREELGIWDRAKVPARRRHGAPTQGVARRPVRRPGLRQRRHPAGPGGLGTEPHIARHEAPTAAGRGRCGGWWSGRSAGSRGCAGRACATTARASSRARGTRWRPASFTSDCRMTVNPGPHRFPQGHLLLYLSARYGSNLFGLVRTKVARIVTLRPASFATSTVPNRVKAGAKFLQSRVLPFPFPLLESSKYSTFPRTIVRERRGPDDR